MFALLWRHIYTVRCPFAMPSVISNLTSVRDNRVVHCFSSTHHMAAAVGRRRVCIQVYDPHQYLVYSTRRKRDRTTVMIVLHTMLMFAICTGHVGIILEYMFSLFLQQNVAVNSGTIPTQDSRFFAFLILLFLNVSTNLSNIFCTVNCNAHVL